MAYPETTISIPRRFADLNDFVERFGVKTATRVIPETATEPQRIEIVWSGPTEKLREAGLMVQSWRVPLHGGAFICPAWCGRVGVYLIEGRINEERDHFRMIAVESAVDITYREGVEIESHDERTIYYGDREELQRLGICEGWQFPGPKRRTKTNHDMSAERVWFTRRTPWGSFIFASETDAGYRERLTERLAFLDGYFPSHRDLSGYRRALRALNFSGESVLKARADSAFQSFMGKLAP
jgi:hypothetical protein